MIKAQAHANALPVLVAEFYTGPKEDRPAKIHLITLGVEPRHEMELRVPPLVRCRVCRRFTKSDPKAAIFGDGRTIGELKRAARRFCLAPHEDLFTHIAFLEINIPYGGRRIALNLILGEATFIGAMIG